MLSSLIVDDSHTNSITAAELKAQVVRRRRSSPILRDARQGTLGNPVVGGGTMVTIVPPFHPARTGHGDAVSTAARISVLSSRNNGNASCHGNGENIAATVIRVGVSVKLRTIHSWKHGVQHENITHGD